MSISAREKRVSAVADLPPRLARQGLRVRCTHRKKVPAPCKGRVNKRHDFNVFTENVLASINSTLPSTPASYCPLTSNLLSPSYYNELSSLLRRSRIAAANIDGKQAKLALPLTNLINQAYYMILSVNLIGSFIPLVNASLT